MRSRPAFDSVQQGVSLALDAHRRGFMGDRELDAILAYYDNEGAVDPFPPAEILTKIGGVTAEQLRELFGSGPARAPSEIQGQRFGDRLTLLEPIGEGGMGTVFRAYDRVLKRVVAVKRLRVDLFDPGASARALARFEREAMAMARVRHPACVQIFDAGLTREGEPYLVMEFVAGKSLRAVIEAHHGPGGRGPIDPRQAATWGAAIAEALQACHDVGLVHRDVKPANVLVDAQRQARLTDFGVALDDTARTKLTVDRAMVGTLTYMAPEQAMGSGRVDARSDVYALGATLYELLVGRPPFDAAATLVLLRQVVSAEPTPVRKLAPHVPVDLETVVMKCLNKAPDDRYATAQALALDLRRFLADEPVLARPISVGQRLTRRLWRARRAVGAAALVSVAATATAVGLRVRAREAERARIDAALAAAAVASDVDAAEREVLPLVAIAEPDQAERAREALRVLRGRRRLQDAEAAFERWNEALAANQAMIAEVDALREKVDPRASFAESPEKQWLQELEQALEQADEHLLARLIELEGLLAQAAVDLPGPEVDGLRARVLLARGRAVEDQDPDAAERFFAAADPLDAASGGGLRDELAAPVVEVTSEPSGAQVTFEKYEFDRTKGHMVPRALATASTPARWSAPGAGNYRVRVEAPGYLTGNQLIQLTRGDRRTFHLALPDRASLGPLADDVVFVPGGEARWGLGLRQKAQVEDMIMFRRELAQEVWHSYEIATGVRIPKVSSWATLNGPQRRTWPAVNMSFDEAEGFVAWFQSELDLARIPYTVGLPTAEQFHRAVRGELCWLFPWGTVFDPIHCVSSAGLRGDEMVFERWLANEPAGSDTSGFGVEYLAGRAVEFAEGLGMVGGGYVHDEIMMAQSLRRAHSPGIVPSIRSICFGVRLILSLCTRHPRRGSDEGGSLSPRGRGRTGAPVDGALMQATRRLRSDASPGSWINRGAIRYQVGDFWGAAWDSFVALSLEPEEPRILFSRGASHLAREDLERALSDATRATELAPRFLEAWALRIDTLTRLGKVNEARKHLQHAMSLASDHPALLELERRLEARQSGVR